jgi:hypothetical protein
MTANRVAPSNLSANRPELIRWLRYSAPLLTLLVLIQAIFAGRGLYINHDSIDLHGQIGNATFLVALIQTALVFAIGLRGQMRTWLLGGNALLLLLIVAQLGLGYGGRDSTTAASLHVPNGVLIFGLTTAILSLVYRLER